MVVGVVVADVVADVVGVVTWQLRNVPSTYESTASLSDNTVASHSEVSTRAPPTIQPMSSVRLPSGPANSATILFKAEAVS